MSSLARLGKWVLDQDRVAVVSWCVFFTLLASLPTLAVGAYNRWYRENVLNPSLLRADAAMKNLKISGGGWREK